MAIGGRKNTMKQKIFRSLFGLSLSCIIVVMVVLMSLSYNVWKEEFKHNLRSETQTIVAMAEAGNFNKEVLIKIANGTGAEYRLTWVQADGSVLYDSNADLASMENHLQRPEIQQALMTGTGSAMRDSSTLHETNYYEAARLPDGSVIRVAKVGANIYRVLLATVPGLFILFIVMALICFFLSKHLTKKLITPIKIAISKWSKQKEHNLIGRLSVDYEEIIPLITVLDSQKERIDKTIQEIETERDTLRVLMEEMKVGILLANEMGQILICNSNLRKFFKLSATNELTNCTLYDLNHEQQWIDHVNQVIHDKKNASYRIEVDQRFYDVVLYVTGSTQRILVIISDITDEYLAQKRRQEFTSNISHELKTPLTTISGYAEIIANELYEKKSDVKEIGKHIYKATCQMLEMIESIMHLSKVEKQTSDLPFETVPIQELIATVWNTLSCKWEDKNITLNLDCNGACMYGNKQLLEEVFLNLLDNAIKFSKGDENTITVTAETQPTMTTVVVHDNGIGINNQKIDCIFERFYQADASRGRYEGFGIGLSLVKHIIDLHKGEIRVESEENKSTSFIISIPNKI